MATTKITAKIYEPLWKSFMRQADALFLKRDAFLNHMIQIEIPHLAGEVKDIKLSSKARRYLAGELKRMGTVPVNIVVDQETADTLKQVVESANLFRDGFINRLLLWLLSSDALLRHFDIPNTLDGFKDSNLMPVSPMKAIASVYGDPFYVHLLQLERNECGGMYTLLLPPAWRGLSCYLSDEDMQVESLLDDIEEENQDPMSMAESEAFGQARKESES